MTKILLNDYYYLQNLGSGQATTWLGKNAKGDEVVVKTLELAKVENWKGIELFEREIATLQQLVHPHIPAFIDSFTDTIDGKKRWHIVQEKASGNSLSSPPQTIDENLLKSIALDVLDSLVYLQSFTPPILHRDIKPANLVYQSNFTSLVDFGSVKLVVPNDLGGSTITGSSGYMAPEQLMGRANCSSDLYALGKTLIYLCTEQEPENFDGDGGWKKHSKTKLSPRFIDFIDTLTQPIPEDRFENAQTALRRLKIGIVEDPEQDSIRNEFVAKYTQPLAFWCSLVLIPISTLVFFHVGVFPFLILLSLSIILTQYFYLFPTRFEFDKNKIHIFFRGFEAISGVSYLTVQLYDFENLPPFRDGILRIKGKELTPKLSSEKYTQLKRKLEYLAKIERQKMNDLEKDFHLDFAEEEIEVEQEEGINHEG